MTSNNFIGLVSAVLFGSAVVAVAVAHQAYLELCVCVVNSLGRASVSLALSLFLAPITSLVDGHRMPRLHLGLSWLQVLAFLAGLFFIVQHIFFALEIV